MAPFTPLRNRTDFHAGLVSGDGDESSSSKSASSGCKKAQGDPDVAMAIADAETQLEEGLGAASEDEHEGGEEIRLPCSVDELAQLVEAAAAEARDAAQAVMQEERTQMAEDKAALERLAVDIEQARIRWAKDVREHLGELLLTGVRQVVGDSAKLQTNALRERLVEVGQRLVGEREVIVRVRPADVDIAETMLADRSGWTVMVDDTVGPGGCVAETDAGKIDATMGAAVSGVATAVREWIDEAEASGDDE